LRQSPGLRRLCISLGITTVVKSLACHMLQPICPALLDKRIAKTVQVACGHWRWKLCDLALQIFPFSSLSCRHRSLCPNKHGNDAADALLQGLPVLRAPRSRFLLVVLVVDPLNVCQKLGYQPRHFSRFHPQTLNALQASRCNDGQLHSLSCGCILKASVASSLLHQADEMELQSFHETHPYPAVAAHQQSREDCLRCSAACSQSYAVGKVCCRWCPSELHCPEPRVAQASRRCVQG